MTTCPACHGKDGLHGLDCGFTSGRPHMTHHDDCGCRSAGYERRIADLEAALAHCALSKRDEDRARSQIADLRTRAEEGGGT